MDMITDPQFVEELLDRIVEIQLVLIRRFIDEVGVDGGYFGDDYGAQKNMLFSPPMAQADQAPPWPACSPPFGRPACR